MAAAGLQRERILAHAGQLLGAGARPTVAQIAAAAGTSKAGFYRVFGSRAALLNALKMEPEPAARERILEAAIGLVGANGLSALSMDDLAAHAGVSRATLYRLFPGRPSLFAGLIRAYTPLEAVSRAATEMRNQPPEVVMPELARIVHRTVAGPGAPGIGMLRALFFEVSSLSPDAESAAEELAATVLGSVGGYVAAQMAEGRLRRMPPLLALQAFVGPIFFHLLTRPLAEHMLGLEIDGEAAVTTFAQSWLRAMRPDASEGEIE